MDWIKILEPLSSDNKWDKPILIECRICGTRKKVPQNYLKQGAVKSCGCLSSIKPRNDITGQVINGNIIKGYVEKGLWRVEHSCGHTTDQKSSVIKSYTDSRCNDCIKKSFAKTLHGNAKRSGNSLTYKSWLAMRRRCNDEGNNRYENYGARGVSYDPRWDNFELFLSDIGERPSKNHSLERLDNSLGYFKGNVIWADAITQANNKRNVKLICNEESCWSLKRWCDIMGKDYKRSWYLLNKKGIGLTEVLGQGFYYK